MVGNKLVFLQAFILAILVFGVGLVFGVYLENFRSEKVSNTIFTSEANLLDIQLIGQVSNNLGVECMLARKSLIDLANSIYQEAVKMEQYEGSSQLTNTLKVLHKKYDLLRILLWNRLIEYNKACDESLKSIVYIYSYNNPDIVTRSKQQTFSRYLEDKKNQYGDAFVLIPIAGDMGIVSMDLIKAKYRIDSYPSIIVNERKVIKSIEELPKLEDELFNDSDIKQ